MSALRWQDAAGLYRVSEGGRRTDVDGPGGSGWVIASSGRGYYGWTAADGFLGWFQKRKWAVTGVIRKLRRAEA